ncbi:CAZyme family GH28 [Aspergillus niger]|uniref:endo-polygalacturonase n=1 Tax=Aspergillus niger TaxID=5061 RepID=A0A9W5ZUZ4_ASPNG|nr:Endopolygalacturonase-2 precursor [Aspergillus niger CBS 101883]KAI2827978.1 CAZyme family GH28 [Aspergillus niger]KAI2864309.1 CAZyme family GH28 [Aspergillus niger]KAI2904141.1 CAZyme family GH28 [Aspergillus niger]KAI2913633.1 CAZyme family GH28 [Aspergillus niger]KAI2933197.1 CAZyme family GH28 [Aspergillus niger]
MHSFASLLAYGLVAGATFASASPIEARDSCTFTTAAAAKAGKAKCSTITLNNIEVPAGTTLDLTGLTSGTKVIFEGTTTFQYEEWAGPLISMSGEHITVTGASGHLINCDGARWWDGKGTSGKKKPKFFYAHGLDSSSITGLNIKNTPLMAFSVQANDITFTDVTINNADGDTQGGHNTDAFDVGNSVGVNIIKPWVHNQDDCLAINSGENIWFTGGTCIGGHGLSIGSVGDRSNNVVKNVTIEHSTVSNSENAVRIKTISGATGSVSEITYSNIVMSGISDYGVVIQQDYEDGKPTGKPTNGVTIQDVKLESVTGSVDSKATEIYLLCGSGSCSDWTWDDVKVTGGKKSTACKNFPSVASC